MPPKDLKFSINQILVNGNERCEPSVFASISETGTEKFTIDGAVITIDKIEKNVIDDRFVSIYFQRGGRFPYSEKVFDTSNSTEEDNPRTPDEIELNEQLFVMIDTETRRIYLSNQKMRGHIAEWLAKKITKQVTIKPLVDEGNFMDRIESVKHISLTAEASASAQVGTSTLSRILSEDAYGYGAEKAVLTLIYRQKRFSEKMKGKINDVLKRKNEFKNVTVVGRTVDGFESVFNADEVVNKIPLSPLRNKVSGKFNAEDVFTSLMLTIKKHERK